MSIQPLQGLIDVAAELAKNVFARLLILSARTYFHACALEDVHTLHTSPQHGVLAEVVPLVSPVRTKC